MNLEFKKNVLNEFRLAMIQSAVNELTDEKIAKAMTVNENLKAFGFVMNAKDVIRLAKSNSLDSFYADFISLIPDVQAKPMYPDFPVQIMEMDEATFRFHQLIHYFSTYGIEWLTGEEVTKGWLPEMKETEKTEKDDALLQCKTIELIEESSAFETVFKKILTKKERLTIPEKELLDVILASLSMEELSDLLEENDIPFKENLMPIAYAIVKSNAKGEAAVLLHSLCQHTGDVLKCFDYFLVRNHYKITKSERTAFVWAIEMYSPADFMNNIILSLRKAERSKVLMNYLNYNRFSRSKAHQDVVASLRDGKLQSWYGKEQSKIKQVIAIKNTGDEMFEKMQKDTLDFIASHPGDMFRQVNHLASIGFDIHYIQELLMEKVDSLSFETLFTTYNHYGRKEEANDAVTEVFHALILEKMKSMETAFKDKKVFIEEGDFEFVHSEVELNERSKEGGYIRSGLAFKIPEDVNFVRFFVYWNDKKRIDIDLHAYARKTDGEDIHVGWNDHFKKDGIYFSGDITHSDAAEFIDVDMNNKNLSHASMDIYSYTGVPFDQIETCFVGLQAVKKFKENIKLYDPKNCFFYHELKSNARELGYGYIDIQNRYIKFIGKENEGISDKLPQTFYPLSNFLQDYICAQNAVIVEDPEEADVILRMDKPQNEKEVSIIDQHFFLR